MTATWPIGLPQSLEVEGYGESFENMLNETQPDIGPPQSRVRTTSNPRQITGQMHISGADLATLRTFFRSTISWGSLPFNFPAQSEAGTWLVKFPGGSMPKIACISGDPVLNNSQWVVQMSLLIMP